MIKILVVEDDENIAKMIEMTVALGGYESDICYNGKDAMDLLDKKSYDVILLDVMLPDMDGFQIMEQLKDKGVHVIFLTALSDVADKVKGLRLGAEDYIPKPFEPMELLARIEVVLRRSKKEPEILTYHHVTMDLEKHIATAYGKVVNLTPKEFTVLAFFIQHVDLAITREKLLSYAWGYDYAGETRTVDIHIQQIRKKMQLQDLLVTIPKLGYRLES